VAGGRHRRRLLVAGFALLEWVLPYFRRQQDPGWFFTTTPGATGGYKFMGRYAHLGTSLGDAVGTCITSGVHGRPHRSEDRLAGLLTITAPLGFAAFRGPRPPAPPLRLPRDAPRVLLLHELARLLLRRHPARLAYAAGVVGLARLATGWRPTSPPAARPACPRLRILALGWICAMTLALLAIHPESMVSPVNDRPRYSPPTARRSSTTSSPPSPGVPLVATGYAGVHLLNRPQSRMLPFGLQQAQWIVLDLYRPPWPLEGRSCGASPSTWPGIPGGRRARRAGGDRLPQGRGPLAQRPGARRAADARAGARGVGDLAVPNLAAARDDASGGYALEVGPDDPRGPGHLFWGPYAALRPASTRSSSGGGRRGGRLPAEQLVATVDVYRDGETLAMQQLRFRDFARPRAWQTVALRFRRTEPDPYEFRVFYHDAGTLALDVIKVRRVGD